MSDTGGGKRLIAISSILSEKKKKTKAPESKKDYHARERDQSNQIEDTWGKDIGRTTSQYVLLLSVVRERKSLRRGARRSLVD